MYDYFVTCPKGAEPVLAAELTALGARALAPAAGGVGCRGTLELGYRACLWSRVGNRVLLALARFAAPSPDALYAGVRDLDWQEHLRADGSLAVDCFVRASTLTHSHFAAQRVKDAVVDQFRDRCGRRPAVDRHRPDLRINLYLVRDTARLALDLAGESLHRRGYRTEGGTAPVKENLAAAILALAGWPSVAGDGGALLDPMCGSGTFPIEAALIAGDVAPGILGRGFGLERWLGHDPALWSELRAEAEARRREGERALPPVVGCDQDPRAVHAARRHVAQAGFAGRVRIEQRELGDAAAPGGARPGLVVANPPYGERLGAGVALDGLYRQLGTVLRERFPHWHVALFTGNPGMARALRLRPARSFELYNGALACRLVLYRVAPASLIERRGGGAQPATAGVAGGEEPFRALVPESAGAPMLRNRLHKNARHLGRWARRHGVDCYRLYDADLPEYAVAVDLYRAEDLWAVVQEYAPPAEVEPPLARARLAEALDAVAAVLELPQERVVLKTRRRQRGVAQYPRLAREGVLHVVREGGCRFWVNFTDYIDTGLFLDQRVTREWIRRLAPGRDVLNLFGYTGTASVFAAAGGARTTTTVDLSSTYLEWARRNLELNGFRGAAHRLVQADCRQWLEAATAGPAPQERYGLIFMDPPTFSTSKRMTGTLDVQRDQVPLIRRAARLLAPGGVLLFCNNYRRFRLDRDGLAGLAVEDVGAGTIPEDFRRNPRIHGCWRITRPG
jgi:23S rRNA (guanine2445-N2)-methyltransferase / 23S rRNA (guanine2069-N7)-methyltransferase